MTSTGRLAIAFLGFGEVGQRFARDLIATGRVDVTAYDPRSAVPALATAARDLGTVLAPTAAAATAGAAVVFSAVTADKAEQVARTAAVHLAKDAFFVDLNSASPDTKSRAADAVNASGARYVEAAVMGAVKVPGITVEILAGGPHARNAADLLNPLGMKIDPVAETYGRASAMKLCRSIMIKGIEALSLDCVAASRHWGVEAEVYRSLARNFPGADWPALMEIMGGRVAQHGVRRAAEMREAGDMLNELGRNPSLVLAVADAQARGVKRSDS
jgi:3-hydroxyisobutyrate dehydrogenase-like beta-hydroxyacid dehydrogenase